jgi:uncharacterized membrane-anchored protein YjiN (DUF445 family)
MDDSARPTAVPALRDEERRRHDLRVMQRRATLLLVVIALLFVALEASDVSGGWVPYAEATLEASMVGGLADWFAITALFRHPLGIPIPHTAVIRSRKDQFARTMALFIQENFTRPELLAERVRAAHVVERAARWLTERDRADLVAKHASRALLAGVEMVPDEQVERVLATQLSRAAASVPVAPLLAGGVRAAAGDGGDDAVEWLIGELERLIAGNRDVLRERFREGAPWWLPEAVEDRVFVQIVDQVVALLRDARRDPDHALRSRLREQLGELADRLETSPELAARVEEVKQRLLASDAFRQWCGDAWTGARDALRDASADDGSELRRRLADLVAGFGHRLATEPELRSRVERLVEDALARVTVQLNEEAGRVVSATIERWDAEQTSDKLELLLGRDLQYIRINGTVVGGLVGLAIHSIAQLFH